MTVDSDVAGAPVRSGRVLGPHYKWIALSNTMLGYWEFAIVIALNGLERLRG